MEIKIAGRTFKPDIRWAKDLLPVLAYPSELEKDFPAYYMYRDIYYSKRDLEKIIENRLRFDLTIIPPNKIGKEYIKTFGHYHPVAENNLSYPEIYEVLEGKGLFLLQKQDQGKITDVIVVEGEKGDKIIIPPNYGHVTINPSNKVLKITNWVARDFKSIYEPFRDKKGACYYYTDDGWIKNNLYGVVPEIRFAKPKIPKELGIKKSEEMYSLVKNIKKLEFLTRPSLYQSLFAEAFKFL